MTLAIAIYEGATGKLGFGHTSHNCRWQFHLAVKGSLGSGNNGLTHFSEVRIDLDMGYSKSHVHNQNYTD